MTGTKTTRRAGFSLIELLVVMSIIAVIAALAGVALFGTTESQRRNSTDQLVDKLQKALDAEYGKVVAEATSAGASAIQPDVLAFAGDVDRGRALWATLQLRRNFPDNFTEATSAIVFQQGTNGPILFRVAPVATFTGHSPPLAAGGTAHDQSAALLYIILTKKSSSGGGSTAGSGDELGPTRDVTIGNATFKTFVDSWGNSIGFRRWDVSAELQTPDYVPASQTFKDPLDSRGLISNWSDTGKRDQLRTVGLFPSSNVNRRASVYSLGKDKALGTADDQLGIRLTRLGAKGKQ